MILCFKFATFFAALAILTTLSECKEHNQDNQANGRRRGHLGGVSPGASAADCATSADIKLYEASPGYIRFLPDKKECNAGLSYVGSTKDGNCHVTLVPLVGNGKGNGKGNAVAAFAASVTCDDTGAVYSIGQDGDGAMTVVERQQEDYGPELDPLNEMPPEERASHAERRKS
jgi:hypothetical protein